MWMETTNPLHIVKNFKKMDSIIFWGTAPQYVLLCFSKGSPTWPGLAERKPGAKDGEWQQPTLTKVIISLISNEIISNYTITMDIRQTKAFMAHLPLEYTNEQATDYEKETLSQLGLEEMGVPYTPSSCMFNYLEEMIQEYGVKRYLIAHEAEPYSHFHFVVEFETEADRNYHNLCKRVFKDKFKLRGQATKGKPRQYGCLKKIENIEKMCAYTLKEGNFRTNMVQEDIDKFIAISRDNLKTLDYRQKILKHLEKTNFKNVILPINWGGTVEERPLENQVRMEIIKYVVEDQETNFKLSKSIIDNLYIQYIQKTKHLAKEEKIDAIYFKFYNVY